MKDKIWFFIRNEGSGKDNEMTGQIFIFGYDKDELEEKYGVREITPGMILKQIDDPDEPGKTVLEILNDEYLLPRLNAFAQLDDAFMSGDQPFTTFLHFLLIKVHRLYV